MNLEEVSAELLQCRQANVPKLLAEKQRLMKENEDAAGLLVQVLSSLKNVDKAYLKFQMDDVNWAVKEYMFITPEVWRGLASIRDASLVEVDELIAGFPSEAMRRAVQSHPKTMAIVAAAAQLMLNAAQLVCRSDAMPQVAKKLQKIWQARIPAGKSKLVEIMYPAISEELDTLRKDLQGRIMPYIAFSVWYCLYTKGDPAARIVESNFAMPLTAASEGDVEAAEMFDHEKLTDALRLNVSAWLAQHGSRVSASVKPKPASPLKKVESTIGALLEERRRLQDQLRREGIAAASPLGSLRDQIQRINEALFKLEAEREGYTQIYVDL